MDHYVTYSKSYYTVGVITGGKPVYFITISRTCAAAINRRLFAAPGDSAQTPSKLAPHEGAHAAARPHINILMSSLTHFIFSIYCRGLVLLNAGWRP
ncbi:hypothetical protein BDFB_014180 [Asbolus verrucosus]|uniref:Uncharacterized protein n=1 Tax=Asbolus verrucosus TaxID=1661398 RepID=A0A482V2F0_ASBVE|nr:hypothetical protein BDFB_014180 [Asbolus verrucosus]